MVKKLPFKMYKKIYLFVPRLCVDIIINSKKGTVLAKRNIGPCEGMWNIPGGTVLFGENLESAVKRIAKEETGLKVKIKKQLGIKEYSKKDAFGQAVSIIYLTDVLSGELNGNEYGKDVRFFKEIPKKTIKVQKEILKGMLGMK